MEGGGTGNPTLRVPVGALANTVLIKINDLGGDASDPSVFRVYELLPGGTQFSPPATIDLPAPPLGAGQVPVIETSPDGVTWTAIPTTLANGRISGPIDHFSFCRSRVAAGTPGAERFTVEDMVAFPDVATATRPNGVPAPGCSVNDLFGVCVTVRNLTGTTVTSRSARVVGWQCLNGVYTGYPAPWPPLDPNYEGAHCTTMLLSCAPDNVTLNFPGGLAHGATAMVTVNMSDSTLIPNTSACFFGAGLLVGIDVLFAEPTVALPDVGMRSAKNGPVVETSPGVYVPYVGNYPVLKSRPDGSPVKNFLLEGRI